MTSVRTNPPCAVRLNRSAFLLIVLGGEVGFDLELFGERTRREWFQAVGVAVDFERYHTGCCCAGFRGSGERGCVVHCLSPST